MAPRPPTDTGEALAPEGPVGTVPRPWQAMGEILGRFARTVRRAYRDFVATGIAQGRRPDLQGGGLRRSQGGWLAVAALRRGREAYLGDERVLGSSTFVEQLRRTVDVASRAAPRRLPLDWVPVHPELANNLKTAKVWSKFCRGRLDTLPRP